MGYYTNLSGGGSRTASTYRPAPQSGSLTKAAKIAEGQRLTNELNAIWSLHQEQFANATHPVAPEPPPVERAAIRIKQREAAKKETSVFARSARRAWLSAADRAAQAETLTAEARRRVQRAGWQTELDQHWKALKGNDSDTVLATLAAAFEDNRAAAAAVGVHGSEVSLVVVVPPPSALPDRKATITAAGNPSLKKFTKSETAGLYSELIAGHMLVTVKEAFATAPAITSARIVAVRLPPQDAYGRQEPEALMAARLERSSLQGVQWEKSDASQILEDASDDLHFTVKGAAKELQPLDLTDEPDLAHLVDVFEADEAE